MTAVQSRSPFPADGVTILDGGLATELERRGNDLSDPLWSARLLIEAPDEIVATHLAYFRAGARLATSASYQASFEAFAARGIDRAGAIELLRRSVELAGEARRRHRAETATGEDGPESSLLVAASVGPYGAVLADGSEYRGDYGLSVSELAAWHAPRLAVLAGAGPDLLAIETIPSVDEGRALVELLATSAGPPAWLSFTCADGARTRRGEPVETAFALAEVTDRVVAVGINCTAPEYAEELIRRARAVTAKTIVAYPNSGETWDARARRWTGPAGPNVDPASARRWVAAGARLIGGCCRVGPDRIAELAGAGRA
ncbi:MAG: homocysteine S-methyltransferase [Candidatus Limnocylindrales bacterium]